MLKLQALLRLLCLWTLLLMPPLASARTPVHPETRVRDFERAAEACVRLSALANSSGHQENVAASTAEAVGYPHATKGVGQIGSRFGPSTAGAAQRLLGNVVQSGGRTINKATSNALNKATGSSLQPRQWGRGLESLKKDLNLPNNHHGKITEYGYYLDDAGTELGNILDFL